MIFILNERVMNGTVTMSISTKGIEAPDFDSARTKLKTKLQEHGDKVEIHQDDNLGLSYTIRQEPGCPFGLTGTLAAQSLEFL